VPDHFKKQALNRIAFWLKDKTVIAVNLQLNSKFMKRRCKSSVADILIQQIEYNAALMPLF